MSSGIPIGITSQEVEVILEVEKGSLGPVGWLVIQEEAQGTARGEIAKALRVDVDDIEAMIHSICGCETPEQSMNRWSHGIVALKTAAMMAANVIQTGWDTIEALAIQKVHSSLRTMQGNGDTEQMIRIAAQANKAIRRGRGESQPGTRPPIGAGTEIEFGMTLQAGQLGRVQLRLSEKIRDQLPNRIIDQEPRTVNGNRHEMIGLNETRGLLVGTESDEKEHATLKENRGKPFHFDLSNGPDVSFEELIQGENEASDE